MAKTFKLPGIFPISFGWLLIAILVFIFASPAFAGNRSLFMPLLLGAILASGIGATCFRVRYLAISGSLAALWIFFTLLTMGQQGFIQPLLAPVIFAVFSLFTVVLILGHIMKVQKVTQDVIFAGISVYFLLAISWSIFYFIIETLSPGSFFFGEEETSKFSTLYIYYSLATITTLGYGEIYPVSDYARIFSAMEGVTGFLYIGVFIARLIALFKN